MRDVLAVTTTPCPFCGAPTVRIGVLGTVRAVDPHPTPGGALEVDLEAGVAYRTKQEGPSFSGNRHDLHRDTCPSWAGPVNG